MAYKTRSDDLFFRVGTGVLAFVIIAVVGGILFELWRVSALSRHAFGWGFWLTDVWDPIGGTFGARPFICQQCHSQPAHRNAA